MLFGGIFLGIFGGIGVVEDVMEVVVVGFLLIFDGI